MTAGAVFQLHVKGEQNRHLYGNSNTSYFHTVYRKRTNFAKESIELSHKGRADFGHRITVELGDYGDLVHNCGIQVTLPAVPYATEAAWVHELGHILIKQATIEIGGRCIDRHYGSWMSIWNELTLPAEKDTTYHNMIGDTSDLRGTVLGMIRAVNPIPSKNLYIPLQFWFNRNASLALPLISLQSDEHPKIIIEFEKVTNLIRGDPTNIGSLRLSNVKFFADYIYLDKEERIWFAKNSFEMIIDQLQFVEQTKHGSTHAIQLNMFNHPLIELIWVVRDQAYETATDITKSFINFTDSNGKNPVDNAVLRINNIERFKQRTGRYFNKVQPCQHHLRGPNTSGINVYSFAEKPESPYEYTGSLNATPLDNMVLHLDLSGAASTKNNRVMVYARNYNILVFKNGFARLKYTI